MKLSWEEQTKISPNEPTNSKNTHTVHCTVCSDPAERSVASAVEQSIDKTMSLLSSNVVDESRYLMFEWNTSTSTLLIAVTDQEKQNDSEHTVQCAMAGLNEEMTKLREASETDWEEKTNELSHDVKYYINNYLPICSDFLRYSLIAAFHNGTRDKSILV